MDFLLVVVQTYLYIAMGLALFHLLLEVPPRIAWLAAMIWPLSLSRMLFVALKKKG